MIRFPLTLALVLLIGTASAQTTMTMTPLPGTFEEGMAAYEAAIEAQNEDHIGFRRAITIWRSLVQERHSGAMYHLGLMHYLGVGGAEIDQPKGINLIHEAADAGYPTAQAFLGLLAESGDGVAVRTGDERALEWYRKAAEANQCAAVKRLMIAYQNGELGLEQSDAEAAQWRTRIAGCRRR